MVFSFQSWQSLETDFCKTYSLLRIVRKQKHIQISRDSLKPVFTSGAHIFLPYIYKKKKLSPDKIL